MGSRMKSKMVWIGLIGGSLLALNPATTQAAGGGGNSVDRQTYSAKLTLVPTPDGPAGATGKADLRSDSMDGDTTGTLDLQTQGLEPGEYLLTARRLFDGGEMTLGLFTIESPGNGKGRGRLKSTSELELDPDIDASDIGQLVVWQNGVALLAGGLADADGKSKARFNGSVPVTGGEAAPDATGIAKLRTMIKKGEARSRFTLVASGVPENSDFTVEVDGEDVGTATSNKKGKVVVKQLPTEITHFDTVRLVDAFGAEILRVEF